MSRSHEVSLSQMAKLGFEELTQARANLSTLQLNDELDLEKLLAEAPCLSLFGPMYNFEQSNVYLHTYMCTYTYKYVYIYTL